MQNLIRDFRLGCRSLLKSPTFTAVAISTLALGIGANTAIYSIVHAVVLNPLDFASPDELMMLWERDPDDAGVLSKGRVTAANFRDWHAQATAFQSMALFGSASFNWTGDGEAEQLRGAVVTDEYFTVLGVHPELGRFFAPREAEPGQARVVVLGDGLWRRRFGASPGVIGALMTLDGAPYEIIGVAPPGVYPSWPQNNGRISPLPSFQEVFVPATLSAERWADRQSHVFGVIGRLESDTTLDAARAEMATLASQLRAAYPRENKGSEILVQPYMDQVYGGTRASMFLLLGAVGLVLLIACANIAALFLARSQTRRREIAVRAALGASRLALVRQLLAESTVLAGVSAVVGVWLAFGSVNVLVRLSPEEIPRLAQASVSPSALAFALAAALVVSLLVGLAPAVSLTRPPRGDGTRVTERGRLGAGLVVSEVALAVVLVVSAGLLIQSFAKLQGVDLGFRATRVLVGELGLPRTSYPDGRAATLFYTQLVERLTAIPGATHAALAYDHPLDSNWGDSFRIVGEGETDDSLGATLRIVTPGYFETVGLDVVQGRALSELDDPEHPGAVIVNQAFAQTYFPGVTALGRSLRISTPSAFDATLPEQFEIVGIVRNVKFLGPHSLDEPAYYLPSRQFPVRDMALLVRTEGDPEALTAGIREAVRALDPAVPVGALTSLQKLSADAVAAPRFNTLLSALFGSVALLLAVLGIYGLLAYEVTTRTNEIGLRIALGAPAGQVIGLVVKQSTRLTLMGVGLGLTGSWLVSRALAPLLFGVEPSDPSTLVVVSLVLLGASLIASYLPARRASKIAPTVALRYE